jgi:ferredoxin
MDIDASGEGVITIRKKAVEMLLSEHRAECEAPCRVVCPAGYNIPLLNRYLANEDFDNAVKLTGSEINTGEIICSDCPGYCENACRRKKIDLPVSIRNIKIFISASITRDINSPEIRPQSEDNDSKSRHDGNILKGPKRFSSHIGKIEPDELKEWLKECNGNSERSRQIPDNKSAVGESKSCMHCDCRAADDCRLREIAQELGIKDPRGKLVNAPIAKKINHKNGLVFENSKCIKCGLCVRICEDRSDDPGLCFIERGFISIISEPLTEEFDNVLKNNADDCIKICPTGALAHFK